MNASMAGHPLPHRPIGCISICRANLIDQVTLVSPGESLGSSGKVAKKLALYLPKKIMLQLGLDEVQRVKYC